MSKKKSEKKEEKPDFIGFDKFISEYVGESSAEQFQALEKGCDKFNIGKTKAESILKEKDQEREKKIKRKEKEEEKKQKDKEKKKKEEEKRKKKEKEEEEKEKKQKAKEKKRAEKKAEEEAKELQKKELLDRLEEEWKNCEDDLFIQVFEFDYRKAQHYFAKRLMHEGIYKCFEDTGTLIKYVKEEGVYDLRAEIFVKEECQKRLGEKAVDYVVKEVINKIKRTNFIQRNILEEQPKNLKAVGNGLFDIDTMKLKEFSPKYIFLNKIPANYNPEADCPEFKKFLKQVLTEKPEKDFKVIQEFLGDCVANDNSYQKAVLLFGSGANGKSVLLKTLKKFLGEKDVVSISIQALENDKFSRARLFGKRANIFFDLSPASLDTASYFKLIITGDPITAEYKGKDSFEFTPCCKMAWSCNEVPRTNDQTPAFFRRWIILKFPEEFLDDDPRRVENLEESFYKKEEMEGILNFAIKGLKRLRDQRGYTENMTRGEVIDFWLRHSDSVASFNMDIIKKDIESTVSKEKIYYAYEDYCKKENHTAEPPNAFWKRLKELCPFMNETQKKQENGYRKRMIVGVKINQHPEDEEEQNE